MENERVAQVFDEIADLLDIRGEDPFRIRSYRNAARTIRALAQRLDDLHEQGEDLTELPGIGKSLSESIEEILATSTCLRLEELRKGVPGHLTELMRIEQLGPRRTKLLYQELGIETLDDLEEACRRHRVSQLRGMGKKTEENLLQAIESLRASSGRMLLRTAAAYVDSLGRHLEGIPDVVRWEVAGSFRRRKETIGDLDILIHARDREAATEAIVASGSIRRVVGRGRERLSVEMEGGLQVDFRFVEPQSFGAAILYFTGSKAHNIALRRLSQKKEWKLNEYGLFRGDRRLAGKTEESVYKRLGLAWIPPELREDQGEVEAAARGELPDLIEADAIRGDLHCHTTASDGKNSIEEMAEAARRRGYQYLAITDHSKAVSVAGGLDEAHLRTHARRIRRLSKTLDGIWLLAGVEVDILKDGRLDLDLDALAELDWVVASIHSYFKLEEKETTDRIIKAVESGAVHCLGHPFGRLIGKREGLHFDFDRVVEACREHGVALEINAQPDRLDLPDTFCRRACEAGVAFSIATDAHQDGDLEAMEYGVSVARRGWIGKRQVINALTAKRLRARLGRR